ncbi:MAG TPA: POTRA domain-containing protein, partial [Gemmatimonadaceae bacterium]
MKRILTAVVVMMFALNARAARPQQILINEIVVESNSRIPDEVVKSETTLVAGKWYSEDQIRNGVARVRRMPLIYDATYSIEGS